MARGKLTPMQHRFVEEYLKDLNATQAAVRAGYSAKTADRIGPELLGKPWVAEAIQAGKDRRSRRTQVDADWVLKRLVRNVNRASTAVPVRDREGKPTGEYQYEGSVVNKALELIGKHVGMFTDRLELSGPSGAPLITEVVVVHHKPAAAVDDTAGGDGPTPVG